MKFIISRRAAQRLEEIAAYIHDRNPSAVLTVRTKLQDTFTLLAARPFIGRPLNGDIRRFAVPRFPYLILYSLDDTDEVTILDIRHSARRN